MEQRVEHCRAEQNKKHRREQIRVKLRAKHCRAESREQNREQSRE